MSTGANRMQVITDFIPSSPFAAALGVRLEAIEPDRARLAMPFRDDLATIADVVHGGAIATLADTAAMAAAWASEEVAESLSGATVSLTLDYLTAGRGDLTADALVTRRGGRLVYVRVDIADAAGELVAAGQAVYSLGR
jgi:uncharacterized protein (TIGR00369 family)